MFERVGEKAFERASRNVWAPRVNEAGVVAFLTDKLQIWLAGVHWRPRERRSVPCTGDSSCQDCLTSGAIMKAYAPVLLYRGFLEKCEDNFKVPNLSSTYNSTLWSPRTLEITRSSAELVTSARPGLMVMLTRPGSHANARVRARILHSQLDVPADLAWDVRVSVQRAWKGA